MDLFRLLKTKVEDESNGIGAEDKISASIVDTILTKVVAEERADCNERRRRLAEGELEKRGRQRIETEDEAVSMSPSAPEGQGRLVRMLYES